MIGIISYLPNDTELRALRLKCSHETYTYLRTIFPDEIIHVVAQNYTHEELMHTVDKQVVAHVHQEGIGPAKARNELLRYFYQSDDEWCIITDDDLVFYDYYEADKFVKNIYEGKYNEQDIDIVLSLSPQLRPFKEKLLDNDVAHNYVLVPSALTDIPNFLILRNRGKQLYYNEDIDLFSEDAVPEDASFMIEQMLAGKKCYVNMCMVKKNLALYDSTLFPEETAHNTSEHKKLNTNLAKYIYTRFHVKGGKFGQIYNKAELLKIPREVPYVLPDNLATVARRGKVPEKPAMKKLF